VVKKDRQQNCYTLAYPKKYGANILPDSLTKTTDASPVYFTHNLVESETIRETSKVRDKECEYFLTQLLPKVLPSKLQRFLDLPQLTIALLWHPSAYWLTTYCPIG
jgi:hypothetical protein